MYLVPTSRRPPSRSRFTTHPILVSIRPAGWLGESPRGFRITPWLKVGSHKLVRMPAVPSVAIHKLTKRVMRRRSMAPPEAALAILVCAAVTRLSMFSGPRDTDNRILNPLLSALFFLKKNAGLFKRLPLYEGTAYILLKKRTYTD